MVTTKTGQINAAVLSIRLLALLERIPEHTGQEDVHRLRTTVRRLEVHLGHCPAKVAKSLRNLRKKAGKVRDIDVHLALLKPALFLKSTAKSSATSGLPNARETLRGKLGETLRAILKAQRNRHLESLRELAAKATPLLQSKLPLLAERATWSTGTTAHNVQSHLARARQGFLQWTRNIPEDAERLHRLRIHTKKLRYSLESLEGIEEAAELAAQLKRVQDAIGTWHDWATLEEIAERELALPDAALACAMLRARTGREYRKARQTAASVRSWMLGGTPAASTTDDEKSESIHKMG